MYTIEQLNSLYLIQSLAPQYFVGLGLDFIKSASSGAVIQEEWTRLNNEGFVNGSGNLVFPIPIDLSTEGNARQMVVDLCQIAEKRYATNKLEALQNFAGEYTLVGDEFLNYLIANDYAIGSLFDQDNTCVVAINFEDIQKSYFNLLWYKKEQANRVINTAENGLNESFLATLTENNRNYWTWIMAQFSDADVCLYAMSNILNLESVADLLLNESADNLLLRHISLSILREFEVSRSLYSSDKEIISGMISSNLLGTTGLLAFLTTAGGETDSAKVLYLSSASIQSISEDIIGLSSVHEYKRSVARELTVKAAFFIQERLSDLSTPTEIPVEVPEPSFITNLTGNITFSAEPAIRNSIVILSRVTGDVETPIYSYFGEVSTGNEGQFSIEVEWPYTRIDDVVSLSNIYLHIKVVPEFLYNATGYNQFAPKPVIKAQSTEVNSLVDLEDVFLLLPPDVESVFPQNYELEIPGIVYSINEQNAKLNAITSETGLDLSSIGDYLAEAGIIQLRPQDYFAEIDPNILVPETGATLIPIALSHANLSGISANIKLNQAFIESGITSVSDIVSLSTSEFVSKISEIEQIEEAKTLQGAVKQAHEGLANLNQTSISARAGGQLESIETVDFHLNPDMPINGSGTEIPDPQPSIVYRPASPNKQGYATSECGPDVSSLGPVAYMTNLLEIVFKNVSKNDNPNLLPSPLISLAQQSSNDDTLLYAEVENILQLEFSKLRFQPLLVSEPVRKMRVALEILSKLRFGKSLIGGQDGRKMDSVEYLHEAYGQILAAYGIDKEKLALARANSNDVTTDLINDISTLLSINKSHAKRYLLKYYEDEANNKPDSLHDTALHGMFGLRSTLDSSFLSTGSKPSNDYDNKLIKYWYFPNVEYGIHTDHDGYIYVEFFMDEINKLIYINVHKQKPVVAGQEFTVIATSVIHLFRNSTSNPERNYVDLSPTIGSSFSGRLILDTEAIKVLVESDEAYRFWPIGISVVPMLLAHQIEQSITQTEEQQNPFITGGRAIIDPHLVSALDIKWHSDGVFGGGTIDNPGKMINTPAGSLWYKRMDWAYNKVQKYFYFEIESLPESLENLIDIISIGEAADLDLLHYAYLNYSEYENDHLVINRDLWHSQEGGTFQVVSDNLLNKLYVNNDDYVKSFLVAAGMSESQASYFNGKFGAGSSSTFSKSLFELIDVFQTNANEYFNLKLIAEFIGLDLDGLAQLKKLCEQYSATTNDDIAKQNIIVQLGHLITAILKVSYNEDWITEEKYALHVSSEYSDYRGHKLQLSGKNFNIYAQDNRASSISGYELPDRLNIAHNAKIIPSLYGFDNINGYVMFNSVPNSSISLRSVAEIYQERQLIISNIKSKVNSVKFGDIATMFSIMFNSKRYYIYIGGEVFNETPFIVNGDPTLESYRIAMSNMLQDYFDNSLIDNQKTNINYFVDYYLRIRVQDLRDLYSCLTDDSITVSEWENIVQIVIKSLVRRKYFISSENKQHYLATHALEVGSDAGFLSSEENVWNDVDISMIELLRGLHSPFATSGVDRRSWVDGLKYYSQGAIIDPDQLLESDFKSLYHHIWDQQLSAHSSYPVNPGQVYYERRKYLLQQIYGSSKSIIVASSSIVDNLNDLYNAIFKLDLTEQGYFFIGLSVPVLRATNTKSLFCIEEVVALYNAGIDVSFYLSVTGLSMDSLVYLGSLLDKYSNILPQNYATTPVTEDEIDSVIHILIDAWKTRNEYVWRQEELETQVQLHVSQTINNSVVVNSALSFTPLLGISTSTAVGGYHKVNSSSLTYAQFGTIQEDWRFFKLPNVNSSELFELGFHPFRSSWAKRNSILDKVSVSYSEIDLLRSRLSNVIDRVEERCLPTLLKYVVDYLAPTNISPNERYSFFENQFFYDFSSDSSLKTTRVAAALEVLQGFLFKLKESPTEGVTTTKIIIQLINGRLLHTLHATDKATLKLLTGNSISKDWKWIESYDAWRSLMFCRIYPENILDPSYRNERTNLFRSLTEPLREQSSITPREADAVYRQYQDRVSDVLTLEVFESINTPIETITADEFGRLFFKRNSNDTGVEYSRYLYTAAYSTSGRRVYYQFVEDLAFNMTAADLNNNNKPKVGEVSAWELVPMLEEVNRIIGIYVYEVEEFEKYFYVFAEVVEKEKRCVKAARMNLYTRVWDSEVYEIELGDIGEYKQILIDTCIYENTQPVIICLKEERLQFDQFSVDKVNETTKLPESYSTVNAKYSSYQLKFTVSIFRFSSSGKTILRVTNVPTFEMFRSLEIVNARKSDFTDSSDLIILFNSAYNALVLSDYDLPDQVPYLNETSTANRRSLFANNIHDYGDILNRTKQLKGNYNIVSALGGKIRTLLTRVISDVFELSIVIKSNSSESNSVLFPRDLYPNDLSMILIAELFGNFLWDTVRNIVDVGTRNMVISDGAYHYLRVCQEFQYFRHLQSLNMISHLQIKVATTSTFYYPSPNLFGIYNNRISNYFLAQMESLIPRIVVSKNTPTFRYPNLRDANRFIKGEIYDIFEYVNNILESVYRIYANVVNLGSNTTVSVGGRDALVKTGIIGNLGSLKISFNNYSYYAYSSSPRTLYNILEYSPIPTLQYIDRGLLSIGSGQLARQFQLLNVDCTLAPNGFSLSNADITAIRQIQSNMIFSGISNSYNEHTLTISFVFNGLTQVFTVENFWNVLFRNVNDITLHNASLGKLKKSSFVYFDEVFYYLPLFLAIKLRNSGYHEEAIKFLRVIYNISLGSTTKYRYPRFESDLKFFIDINSTDTGIQGNAAKELPTRIAAWVKDPYNPHNLANIKANVQKDYTAQILASTLLAWADEEFTQDNVESIGRAKQLYKQVVEVIRQELITEEAPTIYELLDEYDYIFDGTAQWSQWLDVKALAINSANNLVSGYIAWKKTGFSRAQDPGFSESFFRTLMGQTRVLKVPFVDKYRNVNGIAFTSLFLGNDSTPGALTTLEGNLSRRLLIARDILLADQLWTQLASPDLIVRRLTPSTVRTVGNIGTHASDAATFNSMVEAVLGQGSLIQADRPEQNTWVDYDFLVPRNPVAYYSLLHALNNLFKINSGRNIEGIKRSLEAYASAIDNTTGLPTAGISNSLVASRVAGAPTQYRYQFVIDRAKALVVQAQQVEANWLSLMERADAERYNILKAKQDIGVSKSNVKLQDLKVTESELGVELANMQVNRTQVVFDTYSGWISAGKNQWEMMYLSSLANAKSFSNISIGLKLAADAAQTFSTISYNTSKPSAAAYFTEIGNWAAIIASGLRITAGVYDINANSANYDAQLYSFEASFQRRMDEWKLQAQLAKEDLKIGNQQVKIAGQRVRITEQEKAISELQLQYAQDTLNFLNNKFTNYELYDWMAQIIQQAYFYLLRQATAMALTSQQQLAFERQMEDPNIISTDYFDKSSSKDKLQQVFSAERDSAALSVTSSDRKGLTGSTRLSINLVKLDQLAFDTNKRKLQLTKVVSLAKEFPTEFAIFRRTGVLNFGTTIAMLDRDFPGQHMQVIRQVRTNVVALVPPIDGIKATLTSLGNSRTVSYNNAPTVVRFGDSPQSVALTSANNSNGLFEMQPLNEMLLPFEGIGFETNWQFEMQPFSNRIDYSTIADVLISIEYTALFDSNYKAQVISRLDGRTIKTNRILSLKNDFADGWYDYFHPDEVATADQNLIKFSLAPSDFTGGSGSKITGVTLYIDVKGGQPIGVSMALLKDRGLGTQSPDNVTTSQILTSEKINLPPNGVTIDNPTSFASLLNADPSGEWTLLLESNSSSLDQAKFRELLNDVILIIETSSASPRWNPS